MMENDFSGMALVTALALPLVWRGEHGSERLATRLASLTFVNDRSVAEHYARSPNNPHDTVTQATLIGARLQLTAPIFNDPSDALMDYTVLAQAMGEDRATRIFARHADHVYNTNAWEEVAEQGYVSVQDVSQRQPALLHTLCIQLWPLLDCPVTVAEFQAAGYDGAIHRGSGESMNAVEYRVFDRSQITVETVVALQDAGASLKVRRHRR
jgi:hypothetical protein